MYEKGSRKALEDPEIIALFGQKQPLTSAAEGVQMMLFLAANEGARLIEEQYGDGFGCLGFISYSPKKEWYCERVTSTSQQFWALVFR